MEELKLPQKLKKNLENFTRALKEIYQQDLVSLILYGSAASSEFIDTHSDLNVLAVLKNTDPENLKNATKTVHKFPAIKPIFLTEDYIVSSTDIFPIEFLDMQENYLVLAGKDVLKDININTANLRFQCEQEIRSKLLNLKQSYLILNRNKAALRHLLFRAFTSCLHILRNVLRLRGKKPPYQKKEIIKELSSEFNINLAAWERIFLAKMKEIKLSGTAVEGLFKDFISDLEKIAEIVDRM